MMFSNDNNGEVPNGGQAGTATLATNARQAAGTEVPNPEGWWPGYMSVPDYRQLVENYGGDSQVFISDSVRGRKVEYPGEWRTNFDDVTPTYIIWGVGIWDATDAQATRAFIDEYESRGGDDWANTPGWPSSGTFVDLGSFHTYFIASPKSGKYRMPYQVAKVTDRTSLGYGTDGNPIIMSDRVNYQPLPNKAIFNHGREWKVGEIQVVDSPNNAYNPISGETYQVPHLIDGVPRDVKRHALHMDGHVEMGPLISEFGFRTNGGNNPAHFWY